MCNAASFEPTEKDTEERVFQNSSEESNPSSGQAPELGECPCTKQGLNQWQGPYGAQVPGSSWGSVRLSSGFQDGILGRPKKY